MKSKKSLREYISVGALAAVITTIGALPQARGELVYEPEVSPQAPASVRADDREQMRSALSSSEKAKATVQSQQQVQLPNGAPVTAPVQQYVQPVAQVAAPAYQAPAYQAPAAQAYAPAPVQQYAPAAQQTYAPAQAAPVAQGVSAADAPQTDVQSLSKTELMRRERTRTEVKNEDLLEERLEELRLRDEKKRTDQLLGADGQQLNQVQSVAPISGLSQTVQGVNAPITDHPGVAVAPIPTQEQANAPAPGYYAPSPYTPAAQAQQAGGQTVATAAYTGANEESVKNQFSLTPKVGVSNMNVNDAFSVSGKYSAGFSLGMPLSENVSFVVGYTYNDYGVGLGGGYNSYSLTGTTDTYDFKQNVFEAGLKVSLVGPDSKIRPFIGGGAAYSKGYLNYPDAVVSTYQANGYNLSPSYESSNYSGYVEGGIDAKIAKNITIGVDFKYYKVVSQSSDQLNYGSFGSGYSGYGYRGYSGYGVAQQDPAKLQTGTSLSQSSFYTIAATVGFLF